MEQNRIQKYVREVGKKIVANLKTTKHKRKIINYDTVHVSDHALITWLIIHCSRN